jgi:hypothetical protein
VTVAHAVTHTAETEAAAKVATLERQLKAAETGVTEATAAMGMARGDRDQIKAVKGMIDAATKERDGLSEKLVAAQTKQAKAEGSTIQPPPSSQRSPSSTRQLAPNRTASPTSSSQRLARSPTCWRYSSSSRLDTAAAGLWRSLRRRFGLRLLSGSSRR